MVTLLGEPTTLADDYTVDQLADYIKMQCPDVWRIVYTKHIDCLGNYHNFKLPAITLAIVLIEHINRKSADNPVPLYSGLEVGFNTLARHDYPTYYVSAPLIEALKHTQPPPNIKWSDIFFPYDGMIFMLPRNSLVDPVTRQSINYVGVIRVTHETAPRNWTEDRIVLFFPLDRGAAFEQIAFPVSQLLEPSVGYFIDTNNRYSDELKNTARHLATRWARVLRLSLCRMSAGWLQTLSWLCPPERNWWKLAGIQRRR